LYCTDVAGNIVVIDAASGSRVGSIVAPSLDVRPINQETDRVILGTSRGMIQCFREVGKQWPEARILREPPLPRKKGDKKGKQKEGETSPMPIDPFSTPPAGAPPAGTPPAGATDPFGGAAPPAGGTAPAPAGGTKPPAGADPFGGKP
jgi:hypothetical protein